jgi:hypothetical protein
VNKNAPPPKESVTGTSELTIEPQVRHFAGRRYFAAIAAILLLSALAYFAVQRLSSLDEALSSEGAHVSRVVAYDLPTTRHLYAPIEPRTDVVRFVVDAYCIDRELTPVLHRAKLHIVAMGAKGQASEDLVVDVPGERTRVTPGDETLSAGDPIAFDVDVHDKGVGAIIVTLEGIEQADGLLVRIYRREQLSSAEVMARDTRLDRGRKDHLARWTWELGWDELAASEQDAVLATRWRRVGALRGKGDELRTVPLALAVRPPAARPAPREPLLGRVALRGDERLSVLLHNNATLHATSDSAATLHALVRGPSGIIREVQAHGSVSITGTTGDAESVEFSSDRDALVDVRSPEPDDVDWYGLVHAWRATHARPVVIESPDIDRVIRVTVRSPLDRRDNVPVNLGVLVEVTGESVSTSQVFSAQRSRSRFDRYEALDPLDAPSEHAVFFVGIPRGGVATLTPQDDIPLDMSLGELDQRATLDPLATRGAEDPPPRSKLIGESTWPGFVSRPPSNSSAFEPNEHRVLRIPHRWTSFDARTSVPPLAHARATGIAHEKDGRTFRDIAGPFLLPLNGSRPLYLPIVIATDKAATFDVRLEDLSARKSPQGLFERITLPRAMTAPRGETRATFVIGDDIPPGTYRLRIAPRDASPPSALVHLPWVIEHTSRGPRWLAGQFEE